MAQMQWKFLLSPHRLCTENPGKITPDRSPFQRDFDRIVFSGSFRRLQDKTQVFPLSGTTDIHTRLTHSMETASIARSLGTAAGVFICAEHDTDGAHPSDIGAAVAAAALAHDIGNPPMGHAGEEAIRYWFANSPAGRAIAEEMTDGERSDIGKYDGNAQGFRILTRLEMPDRRGGMQLTCATLGTFSKYPASSDSGPGKCGFFQSEREFFTEAANSCGMLPDGEGRWKRHPLSFLLEAADDIAYLTVDFEDALRQGLIDYGELEENFLAIIDSREYGSYIHSLDSPLRKAEFLRAKAIGVLVRAAAEEFIRRHDDLLSGSWVKPLIDRIPQQEIIDRIRRRSETGIYNHPSVAEVVGAGFELVMGMLDIFVPCVGEIDREKCGGAPASTRSRRIAAMLPPMLHHPDPGNACRRLMSILDYISGMTDRNAVTLYQKLKGISL